MSLFVDGLRRLMARERFERGLRLILAECETTDFEVIEALIISREDDNILAIIHENMRSEDLVRRAFAAWSTYLLSVNRPGYVGKPALDEALNVIRTAEEVPSDAYRGYLAAMLTHVAPTDAQDWLRVAVGSELERLRVCAAAALSRLGASSKESSEVLRSAVGHKHFGCALVAARESARVMLANGTGIEKLVDQLKVADKRDEAIVLTLIVGIGHLWRTAHTAIPLLAELMVSSDASPRIRGYVGGVLGKITSGTTDAHAAFIRALKSDDANILMGCLYGLRLTGTTPFSLIERMTELLSHSDEDVRSSAAMAFEVMEGSPLSSLPVMLARAAVEPLLSVQMDLVQAMASLGPSVVPTLVEAIREDGRTLSVVLKAILAMEGGGVAAVGDVIDREMDPEMLLVFVSIAREFGPDAAPIVAQISRVLDRAVSFGIDAAALQTLAMIGSEAASAVPAILRCLDRCNQRLWPYVEQALWNAGPSAIDAITAAMDNVGVDVRYRLRPVLRGLCVVRDEAATQRWFYEFNNDDLIKRFVAIGRYLREHGATSFREMEREFLELQSAGKVADELKLSFGSIKGCIRDLGKARGTELMTHRGRKKGELSDSGELFLEAAEAYLQHKYAPSAAK